MTATDLKGKCGGQKRAGGRCTRPAGWGTDHQGVGKCKLHGGSSPSGLMAGAKALAVSMGSPLDIEPHDALIECVRLAAGQVAFATQRVQDLESENVIGRLTQTTDREGYGSGEDGESGGPFETHELKDLGPELHIWVRVQQDCLDRLARFSKMALDAGVDERRVQAAERWGQKLTDVLGAILGRLELTDAQRALAPGAIREELGQLEQVGGLG